MSKEKIAYHRILLKLSGEALANGKQGLYDWALIDQICARIKTLVADGVQVGIVIGGILAVIASVIVNIYLIYPFFMTAYGMNWDAIIGMCSALIPAVKDIPTLVILSIVPFNALSRTLTGILTMLLYKRISVPLKKLIMN